MDRPALLLPSSVSVFPLQLRTNLEETIRSFRVTNEEMKEVVESEELQECNKLCQVRRNVCFQV